MSIQIEKDVLEPSSTPQALAFVAHGRMGGRMTCPCTSTLAEHLRAQYGVRVVKWNARGLGLSEGEDEYSSWGAWVGNHNREDYNRIVEEEIKKFVTEFPQEAGGPKKDIFICGYSTGAIHATTIRIPSAYDSYFNPVKYILLSYPLVVSPILGLEKTGWYFRALEGLVGGEWEGCSNERPADVLSIIGGLEVPKYTPGRLAYTTWLKVLNSKRKEGQGRLDTVCVEGANHVWKGKIDQIGIEVDKWMSQATRSSDIPS
ncbi:hypothetical protein QCA50_013291 [Cerrena zonata]|uniref:Serine aminopeptidase S33 domain-containing protein n=1 Tax=Cerrena zonata TaxID=2478898 RepID=A0AAW0FQW4_9APHY